MGKTNYKKVEEALKEGLQKMNINQLFEEAKNISSDKAEKNPEIAYPEKQPPTPKLDREKSLLITALKLDLKALRSSEHSRLYEYIGIPRIEIKKKIEDPMKLTAEEWETIKLIKAVIEKYKSEVLAKLPENSNENIVEEERRKHINKRYNVKSNWLPLH